MSPKVIVSSPSRLHFGLAALAPTADARGYGGVGVMVAASRVELMLTAADRFSVVGRLADRVAEVAAACFTAWQIEPPDVRITIENLPEHHAGLGLGTQLALTVARGLAACLGRPDLSAVELANLTGRGRRSAVGTYGNLEGGLIVDGGKGVADTIGRLCRRVTVPAEWRFLLARPTTGQGVSGASESRAFDRLPAFPVATTQQLMKLALDEIAPACESGDFERFASGVGRYGELAGRCFAPVQGGLFASPAIASVARQLAAAGAVGVGQSSWGPTVFGMAPLAATATTIADRFRSACDGSVEVAAPDNRGMRTTVT